MTDTIVDIAAGDDRFDILVQAVIAADLVDALSDSTADLTVFAPTDDAFIGLAQTLGFSGSGENAAFEYLTDALTLLGGGDPIPLLTSVLTYHVAPEALSSTDVLALDSIATLFGTDLGRNGTTLVDQDPDIANPNLIILDVAASNGIIHAIDGVLLPVDITLPGGANDFIIGDTGTDFLFTHGGDDSIASGRGSDIVNAGAGRDLVVGGAGSDILSGGGGADVIFGGGQADIVNGGRGGDRLNGDGGHDLIVGGAGRDVLDGGTGNDALIGDRGADVFIYASGYDRDVIVDADADSDVLDLSAFGFANRADFRDSTEITEINDRLRIDFGDGDVLILRDMDQSDLGGMLSL